MPVAIAASSVAGIITAGAGVITALALLVGAWAVLLPLIRKNTEAIQSVGTANTKSADKAASAALAVAQTLAASTSSTQRQLSAIDAQARLIHTLVNSDMTAARQSELATTREMLSVLRRVVRLSEDSGHEPDPGDLEAIGHTVERIAELEGVVADRLYAARIIEAEAKMSSPLQDPDPDR